MDNDELLIQCFGRLNIRLGDQDLAKQLPAKAQALLVYLVSTERPHSCRALAGLLWADLPEEAARANLRLVLSRLRAAVGDALLITRQSVAFNLSYPHHFDVAEFEALATHAESLKESELRRLAALYVGPLLDDFQLRDAPDFELWMENERERLQRQAVATLFAITQHYERMGQFARAIATTRQILQIEPWLEEVHQLLMHLLSADGQRGAALAHFEVCRQALLEELGVEPSAATVALYGAIRHESSAHFMPQIRQKAVSAIRIDNASYSQALSNRSEPLSFLTDVVAKPTTHPPFVARKRELAVLSAALARARSGAGSPLFVLGGAGDGKSALLQEFARQAEVADDELIVAWGKCNAHTGIGEPYAPFRELLLLLSGDVETQWPSDLLTPERATRLWNLTPITLPLLLDLVPDLTVSFSVGQWLLERAQTITHADATWVARLTDLVASAQNVRLEQQRLLSQFAAFFKALATRRSLVLLLENLQWADSSSLSLLFSLCEQIQDSRILIVATYRPDEVEAGTHAEAQALRELVRECKRLYGNVLVDLDNISTIEARQFVRDYLNNQPNRYGAEFAEGIFRQTEGHPLFTIELLRDLQGQGMMAQDEAGYWRAMGAIDWHQLPARVEGVIEMRIKRLDRELEVLLTVGAVEGITFTAEVIAQVQHLDVRDVIQHLSHELDQQHRLITVQALESVGGQRVSLYRFRHYLFQYYLYAQLDPVERAYLHEAVGKALQGFYHDEATKAATLARHFVLAGLPAQALPYLAVAGENAAQLSAYTEAITHFRQGLALCTSQTDAIVHLPTKLRLQIGLCNALLVTKGYAAPEVEAAYQEAYALCEAVGETPLITNISHPFSLAFVTVHTAMLHLFADHFATARVEIDNALQVCQEHGYPFWQTVALGLAGYLSFRSGQVAAGIEQMERALAAYEKMGAQLWRPWLLGLLAEAYEEIGTEQKAQLARQQARELATQKGEQWQEKL